MANIGSGKMYVVSTNLSVARFADVRGGTARAGLRHLLDDFLLGGGGSTK